METSGEESVMAMSSRLRQAILEMLTQIERIACDLPNIELLIRAIHLRADLEDSTYV